MRNPQEPITMLTDRSAESTPTERFLDETIARRALALYSVPGHRVQLQALPSGHWLNLPWEPLQDVLDAARSLAGESVYLILNPLLPTCTRGSGRSGGAVINDIARRHWLFLDIDPLKPSEF